MLQLTELGRIEVLILARFGSTPWGLSSDHQNINNIFNDLGTDPYSRQESPAVIFIGKGYYMDHGLLESRTGNFDITVKKAKTDVLISERFDLQTYFFFKERCAIQLSM